MTEFAEADAVAFRARLNRRKDPELARLNRELSQARHRLIEAYGERHNLTYVQSFDSLRRDMPHLFQD